MVVCDVSVLCAGVSETTASGTMLDLFFPDSSDSSLPSLAINSIVWILPACVLPPLVFDPLIEVLPVDIFRPFFEGRLTSSTSDSSRLTTVSRHFLFGRPSGVSFPTTLASSSDPWSWSYFARFRVFPLAQRSRCFPSSIVCSSFIDEMMFAFDKPMTSPQRRIVPVIVSLKPFGSSRS